MRHIHFGASLDVDVLARFACVSLISDLVHAL